MMIDGKGFVLILAVLALFGFLGGALVSIFVGPIGMLYGALGVPAAAVALVVLALLIGVLKSLLRSR